MVAALDAWLLSAPAITTRSRPLAFASRSAPSARSTVSSNGLPGCAEATPKLTVNGGTVAPCCGSRQVLAQPVDHHHRVGNGALGDHQDELFTAVARRDVVRAQAVAHHAGEEAQCSIAGVVAVHVVELLEMVEVAVGDDVGALRRW